MSLDGVRGPVRVSRNPECELQAAMAVDGVREDRFFERVVGHAYPGEYGERASARRRGAKFESDAYANNAAKLRAAVGPVLGLDPDRMAVVNYEDHVPGATTLVRAQRLRRWRRVLDDLAAGRAVPDLLIQPQWQLPASRRRSDSVFVSPDFAVLDPAARMYVPGELKSFIVREGRSDSTDLEQTRRQCAAEILALRAEAERVELAQRVSSRGMFIFALPYGLALAPPVLEHLDAEMRLIESALAVMERVRARLRVIAVGPDEDLSNLVGGLGTHLQDDCHANCLMASACAAAAGKRTLVLGDAAVRVVGPDADPARLIALARGEAQPTTDAERALLPGLVDAWTALRRTA